MKIFILLLICISLVLSQGCTKMVTADVPSTLLSGGDIFQNDATATAAALNMYIVLEQALTYSISADAGLLADEFEPYENASDNIQFFENALQPINASVQNLWDKQYNLIYNANAILEGVENSKALSPAVAKQLKGEALFVRAFAHFYLANLFGDVPVVSTSDYRTNAVAKKQSVDSIYRFIESDLLQSADLLTTSYPDASNAPGLEKVRPNQATVYAFLARISLYHKAYAKAGEYASMVIQSSAYSLPALPDVFLKNSSEAIWQLMPVNKAYSSPEGNQFIPVTTPLIGLTAGFMSGFEAGDQRKEVWTSAFHFNDRDYYYPFKYKVKTIDPGSDYPEYSMVFRLAEQYLIRAEASAEQNNLHAATDDLNIIRQRAGLPPLVYTSNRETLLLQIEQERKSELFSEWGHRWFDLKRMDRSTAVLGPVKTSWQATDTLLPIPQAELSSNPFLTQNPGY